MKKSVLIVFTVFALGVLFFSSCNDDATAPKLYWYNSAGDIVPTGDTTILLYTKYIDPGVYVEDNSSSASGITVVNDLLDILSFTDDGYVRRAGDFVVTYNATDEAGNAAPYLRNIGVKNIAEPFVKSYATTRNTLHLPETTYNSSVTADTRIPGRLRFPKVYAHEWDEQRTYFRVNADLYDPENLSKNFSETIGYMGTVADKETPFFENMTYETGTDSILSFTMLRIDAQEYTDTANAHTVYIQGVTDQVTDYPLSRIEYLSNSKTIIRIVLELNVTKNGVVDRVTEIYVPND